MFRCNALHRYPLLGTNECPVANQNQVITQTMAQLCFIHHPEVQSCIDWLAEVLKHLCVVPCHSPSACWDSIKWSLALTCYIPPVSPWPPACMSKPCQSIMFFKPQIYSCVTIVKWLLFHFISDIECWILSYCKQVGWETSLRRNMGLWNSPLVVLHKW